eukprot:CAMPEP_0119150476 /NCGR_PEP_ID=MMETSP1310-20130426/44848_1 /TAXON_ID=464262 /ORGANISM="Genus nov. species nov., Strain RCC2339" /LENGTH=130 /DNA_ID=CAMNT_0007142675 /DNA_START=139 /DNA_END=528 /DNA_ORIENTATION=+
MGAAASQSPKPIEDVLEHIPFDAEWVTKAYESQLSSTSQRNSSFSYYYPLMPRGIISASWENSLEKISGKLCREIALTSADTHVTDIEKQLMVLIRASDASERAILDKIKRSQKSVTSKPLGDAGLVDGP